MRTNQEILSDFLALPGVNETEYSKNPFAREDEILDSFEFNFAHGDLTGSGQIDISANNKLCYWMDYEIGVSAAFCIKKTVENHIIFTAYDDNEYKPVIENNDITALEVSIKTESGTEVISLRKVNDLPFIDIQTSNLIDKLSMQA